ncbi:MAG: glycerate kinase [Pseudomonadota bacterium]|uniref:glycerate kinase n=1 Tax=Polaromonas sp. TaxID=1869339 RepID=UPI0017A39F7A|nr:glycerate kinase [Polaromonas sp.]MBA3593426.1 glycerate kinase [Polaromonas sp.]MDQ3272775.1 glycerate kinase [Pseudomonadota bacterium]
MNFQKILVPIAGVAVVVLAYRSFGWAGVAAAVGGLLMWVLMHFTRMMQVLRRAADQPIGHVASAVMLNAKLRPGLTLMHVVAMTRSLGALRTPKNEQPEIFVWTDTAGSSVTCTFAGGKLQHYVLFRPAKPEQEATPAVPAASVSGQTPPAP